MSNTGPALDSVALAAKLAEARARLDNPPPPRLSFEEVCAAREAEDLVLAREFEPDAEAALTREIEAFAAAAAARLPYENRLGLWVGYAEALTFARALLAEGRRPAEVAEALAAAGFLKWGDQGFNPGFPGSHDAVKDCAESLAPPGAAALAVRLRRHRLDAAEDSRAAAEREARWRAAGGRYDFEIEEANAAAEAERPPRARLMVVRTAGPSKPATPTAEVTPPPTAKRTPPASDRALVTVAEAARMVEGRRAEVVRLLEAAGLVQSTPLGPRVAVAALREWAASFQAGKLAPVVPFRRRGRD